MRERCLRAAAADESAEAVREVGTGASLAGVKDGATVRCW